MSAPLLGTTLAQEPLLTHVGLRVTSWVITQEPLLELVSLHILAQEILAILELAHQPLRICVTVTMFYPMDSQRVDFILVTTLGLLATLRVTTPEVLRVIMSEDLRVTS